MPYGQDVPDAAREVRRDWHPLEDGAKQLVWDEVGTVVQAPWTQGGCKPSVAEMQMRYAELQALVTDAEAGELSGSSWTYVVRDPLLWELRLCHQSGPNSLEVRGYFHEPGARPRQTVLAKLHVKDVSSRDSVTIKRLQDSEIDEAGARLDRCAGDDWGLDRSRRFRAVK